MHSKIFRLLLMNRNANGQNTHQTDETDAENEQRNHISIKQTFGEQKNCRNLSVESGWKLVDFNVARRI